MVVVLPDFVRIDDILPQHVATGTDRGNGGEVHVGNPNGHGSVLLEHSLSAVDAFAIDVADAAADDEVHEADGERKQGDGDEQSR